MKYENGWKPDFEYLSAEEFCVDVVEKQGVVLLPETVYDFGERNFRLGFGRKNMEEALEKLGKYIKKDL